MGCRAYFTVRAGWGLREETVEACASRCARWLNDLRGIHPDFRTLQWTGRGQVATRDLAELCRGGDLPRLFAKRRVHNAGRTRIVPDGYELSARGGADASQLMLRFHAGAGSEEADRSWLATEVTLTIFPRGNPDAVAEMLLGLKPILRATVDAWHVDWSAISSTSRLAQTAETMTAAERFLWPFSGAWAVYLAEPFARRVTAPSQAIVERRGKGGLLMFAAKDVYDAGHPAEVEAASAIDACLAPLKSRPNDERQEKRGTS
jgi:hypothetical protein